jgi:hypothetical protein
MEKQIVPYNPKTSLTSPAKPTAFFSNIHNDGGFAIAKKSIQKAQKGDHIFADLFCLTDKEFIKILAQKKKEGVTVSLNLSASMKWLAKNALHQIDNNDDKSITFYNQESVLKKNTSIYNNRLLPEALHTKTIGWTYQDPENGPQYRLFHGSRNPSYMAQSFLKKPANKELSVYEVDQETYQQALIRHNLLKKNGINLALEQQILINQQENIVNFNNNPSLKTTPIKKTTLQSYQHNIAQTVAERIANTDQKIWIALYAFNDPLVQKSIEKVAQEQKLKLLLIDQGCLKNKENQLFLENLPENAPVYVFNIKKDEKVGNKPTQMHIKCFVREEKSGGHLVGFGSANPTISNNSDINDWTLVPKEENNKELAQDIIEGLEAIKKESTPLKDALAFITQQKTIPKVSAKKKLDNSPRKKGATLKKLKPEPEI